MGQEPRSTVLPHELWEHIPGVRPEDIARWKTALESDWPARSAALRASGVPLNEGDPDPDPDLDPDPKPDPDPDPDPDEGKTFDAAYVKKLRDEAAKHRLEAKEAKARAKEYEDQNKTEAQKLEERATEAEKKASASTLELARLRVALKKGLTEQQSKRLIGDTEEDLEKDADELLDSFKAETDDSTSSSRRPRERLRPGAARSSEAEETDPAKLAAMVPRRY